MHPPTFIGASEFKVMQKMTFPSEEEACTFFFIGHQGFFRAHKCFNVHFFCLTIAVQNHQTYLYAHVCAHANLVLYPHLLVHTATSIAGSVTTVRTCVRTSLGKYILFFLSLIVKARQRLR